MCMRCFLHNPITNQHCKQVQTIRPMNLVLWFYSSGLYAYARLHITLTLRATAGSYTVQYERPLEGVEWVFLIHINPWVPLHQWHSVKIHQDHLDTDSLGWVCGRFIFFVWNCRWLQWEVCEHYCRDEEYQWISFPSCDISSWGV